MYFLCAVELFTILLRRALRNSPLWEIIINTTQAPPSHPHHGKKSCLRHWLRVVCTFYEISLFLNVREAKYSILKTVFTLAFASCVFNRAFYRKNKCTFHGARCRDVCVRTYVSLVRPRAPAEISTGVGGGGTILISYMHLYIYMTYILSVFDLFIVYNVNLLRTKLL